MWSLLKIIGAFTNYAGVKPSGPFLKTSINFFFFFFVLDPVNHVHLKLHVALNPNVGSCVSQHSYSELKDLVFVTDLEFKGSLNRGVANILQLAILLGAGRGRCCTEKEHSALPVRLNDYTWMGNGLNRYLAEIYLKMFICIILLTVQNFCLTVIGLLSYFFLTLFTFNLSLF